MPDATQAAPLDPITAPAACATPAAARKVTSAELFAGAREIEIEHNGRRYQLRITQTGKLILTA